VRLNSLKAGAVPIPGLKQVLRKAGLVAQEPAGGATGIWQMQAAGQADMPLLEAGESDGFLALRLPLATVGGAATGRLPDFIQRMLQWNGRNHGGARFCLCSRRGFCLRAEVVLAVAEAGGQRLTSALGGLSQGWRDFRNWRKGQEEQAGEPYPVDGASTLMAGPGRGAEWAEVLATLGMTWTERSDGTAVVSLPEGSVMLSSGADGGKAEMELADVTGWPVLNQNALGLLLLTLNGRLRLAHAALRTRQGRVAAVLRVNLFQPFTSLETGAALSGLELGISLCWREVRSLESVFLAEKYMEAGVQSLSSPTE